MTSTYEFVGGVGEVVGRHNSAQTSIYLPVSSKFTEVTGKLLCRHVRNNGMKE